MSGVLEYLDDRGGFCPARVMQGLSISPRQCDAFGKVRGGNLRNLAAKAPALPSQR
jgi:hypothetical protein